MLELHNLAKKAIKITIKCTKKLTAQSKCHSFGKMTAQHILTTHYKSH